MEKKVAIFRKEHFNAAHRLFVHGWTDEQNLEQFGKCSNPHFHGHNYELVVKVTGIPDPVTGYVINLSTLSSIIQKHVLARFDHKNLNLDTKEFASLNPTAENIVYVIYEILRKELDASLDLSVRLYETERNFVEYPA
ncbi:MAG TPA: 6-pyruvoyl tetrahydrobiopterin synthase [Chitinophagaceae bacterium]|jgi:6-pyruvoyltetrahydropterin/6-carboxytetrahydropterin synthase|nr:6-pyruvoyl tetrahydrobiopterin synthase [Chitinophagaceae bacterium]